MPLEPLVRPLLIRPHQARVPRHVGSENCGEAADRGHLSRGGRFGLTKSIPKPALTLASRWPEKHCPAPRQLHAAIAIPSAVLGPNPVALRRIGRVWGSGLARGPWSLGRTRRAPRPPRARPCSSARALVPSAPPDPVSLCRAANRFD